MNIIGIISNILGIGKGYLENRAKLKELKQVQEHAIVEAETKAIVDRIMSNTDSDNEIDLITARNKKYTWKDEVITYLFLIPIVIASITPFIIAYNNSDWIHMNQFIKDSYISLDQLPSWYKYVLGLIVIDVLGFRSFARKLIERWHQRMDLKKGKDGN
jgi:hypothetical protein|tara:strand:- start:6753 stop:7229 length:477 start_codon:yes stop_codon:yes gene_type:complete